MKKAQVLAYNKDIIDNKAVNAAIGVIFFVLATALGAYVRIPVNGSPVPITFQTFFVVLSGAVLGRRLGGFSQLAYFVLGTLGLPVFQGPAYGIAHIFGPTGGYLLGFIFAAYLIGRIIESGNPSVYRTAISFIAGNIVLYSFGILWLICLYRISFMQAMYIGILPFIPGEAIKISLATIIYSGISKRSKDIFSA